MIKIVPAFGIHPWWSHQSNTDSLKLLLDILMQYPTASVGEIGLCKSVRGRQVPLDVQVETFKSQLGIAAELKRACVLHCVGHFDKLLGILQGVRHASGKLPPILILHSFSGSPDMMRSFLRLQETKVFISFNAKQLTDPRMKKVVACCKEVPLEALLLETDAPDQAPSIEHVSQLFKNEKWGDAGVPLLLSENSAAVNEPCMVKLALQSATELRGIRIDELATLVYQNSKLAFGIDDSDSN
ncbi:deoxyribonuclease ycfh [Plasmopara halstedii]|uniref:Deoxyribonuclease ycfh n=1 Tax=Plasmopara halstedii TaxID=4781 RepID=A0A0P1B6B5_PLAHL|nr:deoxyribonuclease ycfh [Plasmopara halstedii]CEG50002.1 deoxyribonuclease ycfh [Plasmopara halstedii]|eukprot:XP_024586371.1 deoxyribonuclease ycfh [Plasmopara halstedii]